MSALNETRLKNVKNLLTIGWYISLHFVKIHAHIHLRYGILVRKYKNVTITLQQERENVFKPGIKSLATCLTVAIEIVPPFNTTVQPSASPQAIQKCFGVVQSQCPRVDM
jgi:hypothetical protein